MTLSPFNLMVIADDHKWRCRLAAGWSVDYDHDWAAADGTPISDWEAEGYPLPEDPEFAAWFVAFYHHEAADNDIPPEALNPYPEKVPGSAPLFPE